MWKCTCLRTTLLLFSRIMDRQIEIINWNVRSHFTSRCWTITCLSTSRSLSRFSQPRRASLRHCTRIIVCVQLWSVKRSDTPALIVWKHVTRQSQCWAPQPQGSIVPQAQKRWGKSMIRDIPDEVIIPAKPLDFRPEGWGCQPTQDPILLRSRQHHEGPVVERRECTAPGQTQHQAIRNRAQVVLGVHQVAENPVPRESAQCKHHEHEHRQNPARCLRGTSDVQFWFQDGQVWSSVWGDHSTLTALLFYIPNLFAANSISTKTLSCLKSWAAAHVDVKVACWCQVPNLVVKTLAGGRQQFFNLVRKSCHVFTYQVAAKWPESCNLVRVHERHNLQRTLYKSSSEKPVQENIFCAPFAMSIIFLRIICFTTNFQVVRVRRWNNCSFQLKATESVILAATPLWLWHQFLASDVAVEVVQGNYFVNRK